MAAKPEPAEGTAFAFAPFLRRLALWLVPVIIAWVALTPLYNGVLTASTEMLVRLSERPAVSRLPGAQTHYFRIFRTDYRGGSSGGQLGSVRVTDTHFPVILTCAMFLAMPRTPLRRRLGGLGLALAISFAFHLLTLVFWVKFTYATQLGEWSLANYGPWARNFWGLGKHLLDLPFKFALPLLLWAGFHLSALGGRLDAGR